MSVDFLKSNSAVILSMNKSITTAIIVSLLLTACASINPLDIINPDKPSLEISAQVGKTNNSEKNNIKLDSGKNIKQDAEMISNDHNYAADKIENVTQGMSKFELILFSIMAGFAISPSSVKVLYNAVGVVIKDTYKLILTPFKGLADFILKVLGRS